MNVLVTIGATALCLLIAAVAVADTVSRFRKAEREGVSPGAIMFFGILYAVLGVLGVAAVASALIRGH